MGPRALWVPVCKRDVWDRALCALRRSEARTESQPSLPHAAPGPDQKPAPSLGTSRFFKQSLPNKHIFFFPSRADANGLFKSVWRKINEPTLGLQ